MQFEGQIVLTLGSTRGGEVVATPTEVFLTFSLDDKTSAPEVFCSC